MSSINRTTGLTKKRIGLIILLIMFLFLILTLWLFFLQTVKSEGMKVKAQNQQTREVPVSAGRGTIYDRNGKILAVSISSDSIASSPKQVEASGRAKEIAAGLSKVLDMDESTIYKKITANKSYMRIERKVSLEVANKVRELDYPGIVLESDTKREYPKGQFASHVLGFAGDDNTGLDGIEYTLDKELKGTDGMIMSQYDNKGREIVDSERRYYAPTDGNDVILTIDETIQYFAEREIDTLMASDRNPKAVSVLVMDPQNGDILAMASSPDFDPNEYGKATAESQRNYAVSDVYEPGSTFKILTMAAALEEGVVTADTGGFYCNGYAQIGQYKVRCWNWRHPHGTQTFRQVAENSCNPGFIQVGQLMDSNKKGAFYKYIKSFGLGVKTGIELPGEAIGIVNNEKDLSNLDMATIYMGQGIAVTPIQLITAVSAAVNGGVLLEPHIVKEIRDSSGNIVKSYGREEVRRVVSEDTSKAVCDILESVVADGTGKKAYIEGYRVGGKTGTAQKAGQGGYIDGKYIVSFMGIAPIDDPKLVCLVIVDEPKGSSLYGGTIAGPVFKAVVEDSLQYLGVKSQIAKADAAKTSGSILSSVSAVKSLVPYVIGVETDKAKKILEEAGFVVDVKGKGNVVVDQSPVGLKRIARGSTVKINTGDKKASTVIVPNLVGKRIAEAAELVEALGLTIQSNGYGEVVSQSPSAGAYANRGSIVTVKMDNDDSNSVVVETTGP